MLTSKNGFQKIELSLQRGLDFLGFGARRWKQQSIKNQVVFSCDLSGNVSKMSPDAPKTPPRCSKTPQDAPRTAQDRPEVVPGRLQDTPRRPKTVPRWPQEARESAQNAPRSEKKRSTKAIRSTIHSRSRFSSFLGRMLVGFRMDLGRFWG